jgi:hypothetical protein
MGPRDYASGIDVFGYPRAETVVLALLTAVVGLLVSQVLAVPIVFLSAFSTIELGPITQLVAVLVVTQVVGFGGFSLLYLRVRRLPVAYVPFDVPSIQGLAWIVGGTVAIFAFYFTIAVVALLAGVQAGEHSVTQYGAERPLTFLVLAALAIPIIGPMEELFFRGIVQGTLREVLGPWAAVGLASALFAGVHVFVITGPLAGRAVGVTALLAVAIVLGVTYERTDNLTVPAAIHGLYDAVLLVFAYAGTIVQAGV